jgi:hypothetical protein
MREAIQVAIPKPEPHSQKTVTAKESRFFKSGDGGKDLFRITGKVTRVASVQSSFEEGVTTLLGLGKHR